MENQVASARSGLLAAVQGKLGREDQNLMALSAKVWGCPLHNGKAHAPVKLGILSPGQC